MTDLNLHIFSHSLIQQKIPYCARIQRLISLGVLRSLKLPKKTGLTNLICANVQVNQISSAHVFRLSAVLKVWLQKFTQNMPQFLPSKYASMSSLKTCLNFFTMVWYNPTWCSAVSYVQYTASNLSWGRGRPDDTQSRVCHGPYVSPCVTLWTL